MSKGLRIVLTFVIGMLCFVGLPLVGWGLDDAVGFASHRARLLYVGIVTGLNLYAAVVSPEVGKERARRTKVVAAQKLSLPLLQLISLVLVIAAPYCDRRGLAVVEAGAWVRQLGLALYVLGFLLAFWAQLTLGRLFSVTVSIQEGHRLVTSGLYSRLRHPRYLGLVVFTVGIGLVFRSWVGVGLAGATALVLLWRIRDEEAMMAAEFGEEWRAYARRSWRLVPYLF